MKSVNYFEVTVEYIEDLDNGKQRKIKEVVLVDAISVTESEAKVVEHLTSINKNIEFNVNQSKQSKIVEVI